MERSDVEIGQWLRGLGLQSYEQAFRDNGIDLDVLSRLTADDLREIGVLAVGHRRKILDAIGKLATTASTDEPSPIVFPHAERRQLTVMFCDLVGSTALSARLDPEDMQELLRAYQSKVSDVVSGFGGYISKFLGDGVLVYFGYPQAHEDDSERAIRAGLSLARGIGQLNKAGGEPLNVRVGIATGLVVVGELIGSGEAQERGVAGETPNLAARLQSLAEPGAVIIADGTRRLVGDLFELSELAPSALKGFAELVRAWRVLGEGHAETRFEALHGTRLTPLVGRGEEIDLVLSRWQQAKEGSGQVVLISGEPGIGKSRLVLSLRERLHDEPKATVSYACSPHTSTALSFRSLRNPKGRLDLRQLIPRRRALAGLIRSCGRRWRNAAMRWRSSPTCSAFRSEHAAGLTRCRRCKRSGCSSTHFSRNSRGCRSAAPCSWCWKMRTGSIRHRANSSTRS